MPCGTERAASIGQDIQMFESLAHPRHIQILEELRGSERDVASLAKVTWMARSGVSQLRDEGVDVTTRVLTGKTSVEVRREVLRERHDLVLAVANGKKSKRKGFFGSTALQLLRICPSAVWSLTEKSATKVNHVLGCVDVSIDPSVDAELNDNPYELTSSISL